MRARRPLADARGSDGSQDDARGTKRGSDHGNPRRAMTITELLVVIAIMTLVMAISVPAIQRVRAASLRIDCMARLHQLGLAFHQYHQDYHLFPPGCSYRDGKDPYPHMSWCARLLPYLEQDQLWNQTIDAYEREKFFLANPPHAGVSTIMPAFLCPADYRKRSNRRSQVAFLGYQGVVGINQNQNDGMLYLDSRTSLNVIPDGADHTLLVGERPPSASGRLGWWYGGWGQAKNGNGDMILGVNELNVYRKDLPPGPYEFGPGRLTNEADAFHFWSLHPGGAHFLMAGGSVHFLKYSAKDILPALATRAGGESAMVPE